MNLRAVRGATTVEVNEREAIIEATKELLGEIIERNNIKTEDMVDIIFTVTSDLDKVFPAVSARQMGIVDVPLLDMLAPKIEGSLQKCIRVMLHFNTDKSNSDIHPVYLRGAESLRPDIIKKEKELFNK